MAVSSDLLVQSRELREENARLTVELDKKSHIKREIYRKAQMYDWLRGEVRRLDTINSAQREALMDIACGHKDPVARAQDGLYIPDWLRET